MSVDDTLTPEERDQAMNVVVSKLSRYGLETPAIFFLEMNRPLVGMAGATAHVVSPLFGAFVGQGTADRYANLLGDRSAIDEMIQRLDDTREAKKPAPKPHRTETGT